MAIDINEYIIQGRGKVTLVGSTKYFEQCMEANRQLTMKGWIVLMCGSWGHSYHKEAAPMTDEEHAKVKFLHFNKIDESQLVVLVSDGSEYMGDSTKLEVGYAEYRDIPVCSFDGKNFTGKTGRKPPQQLRDTPLFDRYIERWYWAEELAVKTGMIRPRISS